MREDPTRTILNPQRRALDKQIRAARVDLGKIGKLGEQLRAAHARLTK